MIIVKDLHKSFNGREILKGINLHIHRGHTRVILGLSGSGKSVLMKHLIGLLRPDRGSIHVDGVDITKLDDQGLLGVRKQFGMVFQQAALFDSMTVFENVAFPLREHLKLSEAEIKDRVMDKLEMVTLAHTAHLYPAELSGGMRKRVGLARAVMLDPKCVLYDEPTTGLDPITTENVDQMIKEAAERLKVTSVVISHDIGSALNVADEIAVLNHGEMVEDCKASEIRNSKDPFVQNFLRTWFGKQ